MNRDLLGIYLKQGKEDHQYNLLFEFSGQRFQVVEL